MTSFLTAYSESNSSKAENKGAALKCTQADQCLVMYSLIYFFTKPTVKRCAEDKIYKRQIFAQGACVAIDVVDCEGMVGVTGMCLCVSDCTLAGI